MKECTKCNIIKEFKDYYKSKKSKDGYRGCCKECEAKYAKENKEKINAYKKEWAKQNPQKTKIAKKKWETNNREKVNELARKQKAKNKKHISEYNRKYRIENLEKEIARRKEYRIQNKERYRVYKANRRAKTNFKQSGVSIKDINELIKQSDSVCFWCEKQIPDGKMHIDHIYPLSKNGEHNINNLVISCSSCNHRKGAKDPVDFLDEILMERING